MSAGTVTAVIVAAVAVLGALLTMARLVYLAGKLEGRVETVLERLAEDRGAMSTAVTRVADAMAGHLAWHASNRPGRARSG